MKKSGLEINRFILRRFEENDMEAMYLLFSDKEVKRFFTMVSRKRTEGLCTGQTAVGTVAKITKRVRQIAGFS